MEVSFSNSESYIHCTIADSGIGRAASRQLNLGKRLYRKSKGMSLTQKRLELINKNKDEKDTFVEVMDLHNEAGESQGTRVTIKIYKN